MKFSNRQKWCARDSFSVSAVTGMVAGKVVATPTRHFKGTHKFTECELYGKQFNSSDEAFAAMHERGYGVEYFKRTSVPSATLASNSFIKRQCKFDALYRQMKHKIRRRIYDKSLMKQVRELADEVGIFHPCAKAMIDGGAA